MNRKITDPDVQLLAGIATMLQVDYPENDDWAGSPFAWIKQRPSRQVGKIGEQLVSGWCAAKGLSVGPSGDTEADKVIQGQRVEIKFSTLWKSGLFKFQQIRDQDYAAHPANPRASTHLSWSCAVRCSVLGHTKVCALRLRDWPYTSAHRRGWNGDLLDLDVT